MPSDRRRNPQTRRPYGLAIAFAASTIAASAITAIALAAIATSARSAVQDEPPQVAGDWYHAHLTGREPEPIPFFLQLLTQELYRDWRRHGENLTPNHVDRVFERSRKPRTSSRRVR